jgi:DNA-binding NarL/FixJ family response regulator
MPIAILIVEPNAILRAGIQLGCQNQPDFSIAGHYDSLADALNHTTTPDVLVFDPATLDDSQASEDYDGNLLAAWRSAHPNSKVLALASRDSADDAAGWMDQGVSGYISKHAAIEELVLAIRVVHQGRVFVSHASHGGRSTQRLPTKMTPHPADANVNIDLSDREREVLSLVAEGMTNKQAASRLFLSVKTVETYRSRVMRKHGLRDRADLVRFARQLVGVAAVVGVGEIRSSAG